MSESAEKPNVLEMSDDDFMRDIPLFDMTNAQNTAADTNDENEENDGEGVAEGEAGTNADKDAGDTTAGGTDQEEEEQKGKDAPPVSADEQNAEGTDDTPSPNNGLTDAEYAAIGRQIMSEFKANGTVMKVKSAADAMQLMQMGANYHKKMVGLKPSLKTLKLLENHDLLNHDKLNFLIDLHQKKPEAIKQLLQDSDIDPLSIDMEDKTKYVPQQRTVNDKELLLDEVLNNISESQFYERTLDVIGNKWDEQSRKAIADTPELIAIINSHMEHGIFDQVAQAVAYERSIGNLTGVSELDAYQRVGAHMHENKLFKGATEQPPAVNQPSQVPAARGSLTAQQQEEKARQERKRAASPSRQGGGAGKQNTTYNPLTMSDEEFEKINKLNL